MTTRRLFVLVRALVLAAAAVVLLGRGLEQPVQAFSCEDTCWDLYYGETQQCGEARNACYTHCGWGESCLLQCDIEAYYCAINAEFARDACLSGC